MRRYCRVAVAAPLHREFDYFSTTALVPGQRVAVVFGRRRSVGVVTAVDTQPQIESSRIRAISDLLDKEPVFDARDLQLLRFAAGYYQHPIGEVIVGALPRALRTGRPADESVAVVRLSEAGRKADLQTLARAPRQQEVLTALQAAGLNIKSIEDCTPIPHNGCRPRKKRRV